MEELNREKQYTVCGQRMPDRQPYFTQPGEIERYPFSFRPVGSDHIRFYHIADVHNFPDMAIAAATAYGPMDFLVLNGDIPDHSGDPTKFDTIYELASALTAGEIPIVFARGNHDMRGLYADRFADYTPTDNGRSFFTFRLGSIWGMVLDCGEDKLDEGVEYGGTICCHSFRLRETQFIQETIRAGEYLEPGVQHRLVISHIPFFFRPKDPLFDIEDTLYTQWCSLLKESIKPTLMLCGHKHMFYLCEPGGDMDDRGLPCLALIGPARNLKEYYISYGVQLDGDKTEILLTNDKGETVDRILR